MGSAENHDGLWLKREDLYADPVFGVNGSKYRTWKSVVAGLPDSVEGIVVGGSVHAPTVPIAAVAAAEAGRRCTVIVGGTTPEKAVRHRYIQIAADAGADITAIGVGYNPALQKASRAFSDVNPGVWRLAPPDPATASQSELEAFLCPVGGEVANLPPETETLVVPFGSGNTAAGIFWGLAESPPPNLKRVVLVGIGPDRLPWLHTMLNAAGVGLDQVDEFPFAVQHTQTHPWYATYSDRMPAQIDGIEMHPTYEGKVVRFLNSLKPPWWTRRDGTTCLWIVGGPF